MTKTAGIYARMSLDSEGTGLGVSRQVEDCSTKAGVLGWLIADRYTDNDVSASKSKARPEYQRLMADLEAGRLNAVIVYDLDRLTRKPVELEAFIDLTDRLGVSLANVSGEVDLTTSSGRMTARIKGAVARQEAERIGERVKRQKEQRLAAGMPPGSRYRTFGYARDWKVIPEEAEVVLEVFERVAAGESLNSVSNDLIERDVRRVSGALWSYQTTARMVGSPIYAGFLTYKGERAGRANVEPLVSPALLDAAAGREKRPGRINARKHLLSGIATCGLCFAPMTVTGRGSGAYICNRQAGGCGNVRFKRAWLDEVVENAMKTDRFFAYLTGESATETEAPAGPSIEDQIETVDGQIGKTRDAMAAETLDFEDGAALLASLRKKRKSLTEARQVRPEGDAFLAPLADWESADVSRKAVEVRGRIAAVVVKPSARPGRTTFDPERFEVRLTTGEVIDGPTFVDGSMRFRDVCGN